MPDVNNELKTPEVVVDDGIPNNIEQSKEQCSWSHSTELWKSTKLSPPGGERIIGRNRVFLRGWCLVGPGQQMAFFALILIVMPCTITDAATIPWYHVNFPPAVGIFVTVLIVILQFMTLVFFLTIAYSDPGILPRANNSLNSYDLYLDQYRQNNPPKYQEITIRGHLFRLKYCSTCNFYRCPRTIHCYVCNNCVEQFDHHCPWFGNCIGKRNYRRFYLFLAVTSILIISVLGCSSAKLIYVVRQNTMKLKSESSTILKLVFTEAWDTVILVLYTLAILWFVIGLCIYHTYLIGTNQSTYEQIKGVYDNRNNPWNKGVWNNLRDMICHKHRPSIFDARNLTQRQDIHEPRYLDPQQIGLQFSSAASVVEESGKNSETCLVCQEQEKRCHQTSYCGLELCLLPNDVETSNTLENKNDDEGLVIS